MRWILVLVIIASLPFAYAISGVSPASYEINFQPGLKQDFEFNFIFDEGSYAKAYASGDFSDNVKLNKDKLRGLDKVTATINLPAEAKRPGKNVLRIGAKEMSDEEGFALTADVGGLIIINVPYPGKYIEVEFATSNANVGDIVNFTINVKNKGKEEVDVLPIVKISDPNGRIINEFSFNTTHLALEQSVKFFREFPTLGLNPGNYNITAYVFYGADKPSISNSVMKIGHLFIDVVNCTREFVKGKINRFEIEAESFWNEKTEGVYAEIEILNTSERFKTPSIDIGPWEKGILTGFFDTSSIEQENFKARIILRYSGISTVRIVDLKMREDKNYLLFIIWGLIGAVIVLTLVIIIISFFLIRKSKKINPRKNDKRTKNEER